MHINRRNFIQKTMMAGLAANLPFSKIFSNNYKYNIDMETFKTAQQKLLDKYNVAAKSKYLKLEKPALTAHVLESGKGEPVVMLHGGGAFAAQFAPLMSKLQEHFHLYVPDRPGCGLSDMINYTGVPFREHAVNFVAGIMDNLKLKKATLIGNSMGGYWALLFALAHPERVSKLILIGEPAASSPPGTVPFAPPADKNPTLESVTNLYKFILVADINKVAKEILEADLAASRIPGAAIAWDTMLDQFKHDASLGTYALRPEMKNMKPETLFIWGEQEKFGPPQLGNEMAAIIPNAHCEVVPGAAHLVWLDQLDLCTSSIMKFL
jgi:pimeloyl-ACP methyl ester carboxylesterase